MTHTIRLFHERTGPVAQGPTLSRTPRLIIFERGTLHFHFALGPQVMQPVLYVPSTTRDPFHSARTHADGRENTAWGPAAWDFLAQPLMSNKGLMGQVVTP